MGNGEAKRDTDTDRQIDRELKRTRVGVGCQDGRIVGREMVDTIARWGGGGGGGSQLPH